MTWTDELFCQRPEGFGMVVPFVKSDQLCLHVTIRLFIVLTYTTIGPVYCMIVKNYCPVTYDDIRIKLRSSLQFPYM